MMSKDEIEIKSIEEIEALTGRKIERKSSSFMREFDPGPRVTDGNIYQKIYNISRRILDRDTDANLEGIDLILDTFAEWDKEGNAEAIDEFLHRINLRKVHHELVSCIQDQVNESKLQLTKRNGFNKCANLVLKKIDDFRENLGAGTIGVTKIDLPDEVGCKDNEILTPPHLSKSGRWVLSKKDGGKFTKEEIEEVKERLFIGEIQTS